MTYVKQLLFTLLLALMTWGQAHAFLVTDMDTSDANIITSQEFLITTPENLPVYQVAEDYNERYLVPYPSHDGNGIVNQQGGFFDKIVDLEGTDGWITLNFQVTNTSPYVWSDYHFEFWQLDQNREFQTLLTSFPLRAFPGDAGHFQQPGWRNDIFQNSGFDGSILSFWSPLWQAPGQTNDFFLTVNLDELRDNAGNDITSFGIRQVATTPEPSILALLGISWMGFALARRLRLASSRIVA